MSRTRLIASLTAIAACLAVVATLAVWTFPLKAALRAQQNPPLGGIVQGVSGGVIGVVTQGVPGGVIGGVTGGAVNGVPGGIISKVPGPGFKGGVNGGAVGSVTNGVPTGIIGGVLASQQQDDTSARKLALIATKRVPPVYPSAALENHLEGRINLTVTVNAEGKVSNVDFINGSSEFLQSATDAILQWEFEPPAKSPAIMTASFDFTLNPTRRASGDSFVEPPRDPRAVSALKMAIAVSDPSPKSAPPSASFIDSHMVGEPHIIPPSASVSQSTSGVIYRAGENGVTMPTCEFCPRPEYSPEAREANIQGTVYLQVIVLTTGRAGEIKVIKGFEKSLDEQAIKVIREKWTFKPATDRNGDPVNVIVPVEIAFQLFGPPQPTPPPIGRSAAASPATAPLTPDESLQTKIFTGPVSDDGKSTPFYMGLVKTQTIYAPQPELPRLARQANVQGSVTLNIVVNAEGKVIVVEYVKGPAMLAQSAISTVRDWIIKGTHDGVPVTFQISVEVGFNSDK